MVNKTDKFANEEAETIETEEEVSLDELNAPSDDEDLIMSVEEPKTEESPSTVNADDSVKMYLQQIGKIPLLTAEEELKVAKEIKDKSQTAHQIFSIYQR